MEETISEAELLKDMQSQQSTKQLLLLTVWKLNLQEDYFDLEGEKGKRRKGMWPLQAYTIYHKSFLDKFQSFLKGQF